MNRTTLKSQIESVFNPRNLDEDCRKIETLLRPFDETVHNLLKEGQYEEATTIFLEILDSLSTHYVRDEHFCYFDDMYSPDYPCDYMMEAFIKLIEAGSFPQTELSRLKEGMERIAQMEAFQDYGSPMAVFTWRQFLKQL